MSKSVTRLFEQFQPEHYNLQLQPNGDTMVFSGSVVISGHKIGRPSKRLTLHQKGLTITKVTLIKHEKQADAEVTLERINTHNGYDEVRLHSSQMIYPGKYTISLEFEGKITEQMNGLYPCFFKHDNKDKQLLATQFESHHAREVFPCIDEPEAKATFDLTLTTPKGPTVIANTPIIKQQTKKDVVITQFETTPKMSSYLLAFVVGELGFTEATTKDGVLVRAYATPDNVAFTNFALDVAVKCLDFYNDYFGLAYPLPKCDLIALPDFASGAMENWGCITFREQCMLVDPSNTSLGTKQYVAMVVAHELAHQWFGNLVTMRWWTDLWLNEGFASWIEYLAVDHIFPDWQMWTQFYADEQQAALRLDALENTHPIEVTVKHPDEIRTIFDAISYSKGASVIHMLHEYLGADDFKAGLQHYLKKHKYRNTDTVDLWQSLAKVSGKPVQGFMHSWTAQSGFPVVSSKLEGQTLTLSQERFLANPQTSKDSTSKWPIVCQASQLPPGATLSKRAANWQVAKSSQAVKLNMGQSGFYRTIYDEPQIKALSKQIKAGKLGPLDRMGLLSDAFETAKAGYSSSVAALQLLQNYQDEDNNAVWDVISGGLGSIRVVMDDHDIRESMKPIICNLTAKQLTRLGWEAKKNESHFDSLLRPTIIGLAAMAEEPTVAKEAAERFAAMKSPNDLPADLRAVIYGNAARHGDAKTFDKLLKLHNSSSSSEERTTLASALTGFKQPQLIERALGLIIGDNVRPQDISYWVAYSFMNRHAKAATWLWLTSNWQWLGEKLGSDMSFSRFPIYAARSSSDLKFLEGYKKFFEPLLTPAIDRAYKQGYEIISMNASWKQRDLEKIRLELANSKLAATNRNSR